jgi:hypothetical protein
VTCYTQPCKPCRVTCILHYLPLGDESSPRGRWGICAPDLPDVLTLPAVGCWAQAAAGDKRADGCCVPYARQDKVMLPYFSGGWGDEAAHFLSLKKTGLEKIQKCIIFIVQLLHDLVIGAISHIFRQHSPDGTDRGTGRTRVLFIGDAPAFRDLTSGSHIVVLLQILHKRKYIAIC